jgi:hypothetical protein
MGGVGQNGSKRRGIWRAGEQGHGDVLISRKYCRTVPWTFVKQVGQ